MPAVPSEKNITYPPLPDKDRMLSPSPEKRRQTAGPGDFTFRADNDRIVVGKSPNAPASAVGKLSRPSTIRFISHDATTIPAPIAGSKKRKHEFEDRAAVEKMAAAVEDKENVGADEGHDSEEDNRPAKRMKPSGPDFSPKKIAATTKPAVKPVERRTTLGVKPKGVKTSATATAGGTAGAFKKRASTTTISQARLNALSQPKKRG
jgi:hypothetical protein